MIREYIEYVRNNKGLTAGTCEEYTKDLETAQEWLRTQNVTAWSKATKATWETWVAEMSQSGLMAATIKRRISAVRGLYQYAWIKGYGTENPARYVSTPKLEENLPNTLLLSDIEDTVADEGIVYEVRLAIALMAETGMRSTECRTLRREDIDEEGHTIRVKGKGRKERYVMYGELTELLLKHCTVMSGKLFEAEDYAFRHAVWAALRQHTRAEKCGCHTLRHTFASTMLNNGAPLSSIQILLGHSTVKTTERYARVAMPTVRQDYQRYWKRGA